MKSDEVGGRGASGPGGASLAGGEEGMALIVALLMIVLLTGMGLAAIMMANMDATVSGHYRAQRSGEVAADGAMELTMALIFGNVPMLSLPVSIDATWPGTGDIVYQDGDLDVTVNIVYKLEDSINYNTVETYADEVVRYGQDYNYASAQKTIGKQPVYTVALTDNRTGVRAEADVISQLGFKTPAAIFVKGTGTPKVEMMKNPYATEEKIEVTSGAGTPALATTMGAADVFIQRAVSKVTTSSPRTYTDQRGGTHSYYVNAGYLYTDVYTDANIAAEIALGHYGAARNMMHCLLGVGDRNVASAALDADPSLFNFNAGDANVVRYNYVMPGGGTLEEMIGATFPDFRELADQVIVGNESVVIADGSTVTNGKNLSGMTLGNASSPQIVFFESNMNDDGSYSGAPRLTLVTTGGSVHGYGILVINGDANIQGSIDWTGLMLVRGDLVFRPWQGGTAALRSDATLASRWNGWIMIGGNMELWTWYGGTIVLGYSTAEAAAIKGIISAAIPHKVLSWRKVYD